MNQQIETTHNFVPPRFTSGLAGRLVKLLIASAFYIGRELIRRIERCVGRKPRAAAVAIYYHQVPGEQRGRFARQMDHLLGWAVPIRADRTEPLPGTGRYAMVTADDGWTSFIDNALPELERREIPVTIFAISDCPGQNLGEPHDRLATADELRRVCSELVCVGSHTATHARLTEVDGAAAWEELRNSRARLERLLNRRVTLFAFPFGAYNNSLIDKCRDAGYKRVFLCLPSPALREAQEFVTGRVRVDPADWPLEFHLKLMGAYSWMPWAIRLKRRILSAICTHAPQRVRSVSQIEQTNSDSNAILTAERHQPIEDAVRPTFQ